MVSEIPFAFFVALPPLKNHLLIEEVQPHTVCPIWSSLLCVEVVKRTPIVLVDIVVLHQHRFYPARDLRFELLHDAFRLIIGVEPFQQLPVVLRTVDFDPIV